MLPSAEVQLDKRLAEEKEKIGTPPPTSFFVITRHSHIHAPPLVSSSFPFVNCVL